ncbi:hypothetical protein [Aquisphaera insulae]|uniref:hypothetical protein n=1 Tax=Aquisphaera insulae TaxID=2712864 RepID=UPI0013EA7238|nr:hypothetical protein [Aquisphaera insulae]
MNNITIEVWDATGNKKQLVELPSDAPINRVIAVLVDRMNLPRWPVGIPRAPRYG